MNTKELLTKSIMGVIEQGEGSYIVDNDENVSCLYRSDEGNKCAVGHLISDECYEPRLEHSGTTTGLILNALEDSIGRVVTLDEIHYLRILQQAHDVACKRSIDSDVDFIDTFKKELGSSIVHKCLPDYIGDLECMKQFMGRD